MLASAGQGLYNTIEVDYNLSTRDLFIRVALYCQKDLDWPLSILEICRLNATDDLPS